MWLMKQPLQFELYSKMAMSSAFYTLIVCDFECRFGLNWFESKIVQTKCMQQQENSNDGVIKSYSSIKCVCVPVHFHRIRCA